MALSFLQNLWRMRDESPPITPIPPAPGIVVEPGTEELIVEARAGRVQLDIDHCGDSDTGSLDNNNGTRKLWLGFNQTAVVGTSRYLLPGGFWSEPFAGSLSVFNAGDNPVLITPTEWAASE